MKVGYARTSTVEQVAGFDAQKRELTAVGCERVFAEQVSSVSGKREQLEAALEFIREGDVLVVTRLDRLARNTADLLEIERRVTARGATLQVLNLNLDTSSATGKLLFTMVGAIGAFERELMLERQREGIAKAKAEGKYKGRKPTAMAMKDQVATLKADGVGPAEIAKRLGVARSSVYRVLDALEGKAA